MASVKPGQEHRQGHPAAEGISAARRRQMATLQLALYLVVGGISFCVDIGGFVALRYLQFPILPASATSFVTATLVNYLLCCALVFRSGRFSRPEEVLRLFVIAVVGLGLNSAVVWFLAVTLRLHLTLAKVLAVFPVFAWNYLGRRELVFDGSPPAATALLAERVRGRFSS
jgi:putative flippase GtrA